MTETAVNTDGTSRPALRGHWLIMARAAWMLVAALVIGLSAVTGPNQYNELTTVCQEAECSAFELTPENAQDLEDMGLSLGVFAGSVTGLRTFSLLLWVAIGALIFWSRSDDPVALFTSVTLLANGGFLGASGTDVNVVVEGMLEALAAISFVLLITLFFIFPDGRFVPRWSWRFLVIWGPVAGIIFTLREFVPAVEELVGFAYIVTFLSPVVVQVYRYRKVSTPWQRQQTKWVLLGMAGFGAGAIWPYALLDEGSVLFDLVGVPSIMVTSSLFPLAIAFSILRYRLWDLGIFLNRALVYGVLTGTLVGTYIGIVIGLQAAFRAVTDQGSGVVIVISTLTIAALFRPFRSQIQAVIDRRFYRRRYDAARTLAAFNARTRDEVDLERLSGALVSAVQETMQPAHVSLWLRESDDKTQRSAP